MVWFHGGAYAVGSGSLPIFDGERLARHGVIVVTVNYRLGRLGFLAHPALSRESPHHASGNYGLLDQVAALGWIKRNIALFGGDPDRVTIFGQSVGSTSVHCHMVSPLARGLFQRAIGQSGGAFGRGFLDRDTAERAGDGFARLLGATTVAALRALPARIIQQARVDAGGLRAVYDAADPDASDRDIAWAIIDGHVLTEQPDDSYARGGQADVPLLTGSTADEGATQPGVADLPTYLARAEAEHGAAAASFLKLYPATTAHEAQAAARRAGGDHIFAWQNWLWALLHARAGRSPAYYYHFSRVPPRPLVGNSGDIGHALGAFHTAEIPYVFDHLAARDWPWQETDRRLAATMSSYWVNFAATGNPNGAGLPTWPGFDEAAQKVMIFGDETRVGTHPAAARIAFWQAHDQRPRTR